MPKKNRDQRRHPERQDGAKAPAAEPGVFDAGTPPDVTSVRAKSSGHKKRTADKWNQ
jgi:hypothetical protein